MDLVEENMTVIQGIKVPDKGAAVRFPEQWIVILREPVSEAGYLESEFLAWEVLRSVDVLNQARGAQRATEGYENLPLAEWLSMDDRYRQAMDELHRILKDCKNRAQGELANLIEVTQERVVTPPAVDGFVHLQVFTVSSPGTQGARSFIPAEKEDMPDWCAARIRERSSLGVKVTLKDLLVPHSSIRAMFRDAP